MGVPQGIGELVLAACHQLAPGDAAGEQELEVLRETGFSCAVRSPYDGDVRRQIESLLGSPVGPKAPDGVRFNPQSRQGLSLSLNCRS
jgi:hypothetical protein